MADIDWNAPVGGTAEVLACVPGLGQPTLAKWQSRDKISRRGTGRGRATVWHAADVLEIATLWEVGRLGLLPHYAAEIWRAVHAVMLTRMHPAPGQRTDQAIIFERRPDGQILFRHFYESTPSNHPTEGSGLNRPDAPSVFLMFRMGRFVDGMAQRIAAVAPHTVRRP